MALKTSRAILVLAIAGLVAGCASNSKDIRAAYVSPITYDAYSCEQQLQEANRLQAQITSVAGDVDKRASGDKVKMGVGLVLFWPTLFFLKGDGPQAQEYAHLKGSYEALEGAYIRKNCAATVGAALPTYAAPSGAGTSESSDRSVRVRNTYSDSAKSELAKLHCERNFKFVSGSNDHEVYQATCQSGKDQLLECDSVACKTMK